MPPLLTCDLSLNVELQEKVRRAIQAVCQPGKGKTEKVLNGIPLLHSVFTGKKRPNIHRFTSALIDGVTKQRAIDKTIL